MSSGLLCAQLTLGTLSLSLSLWLFPRPKHFLRKRDMTMYEAREDADGYNLVAMRAQAMREFSPSLPFAFTPFQTDHSYTSWQSFDAPAIDTGRILVPNTVMGRLVRLHMHAHSPLAALTHRLARPTSSDSPL